MSLSELLDRCVKESFSIDKIIFHLKCFDLKLEQSPEQMKVMKSLIGHLASNRRHKSAVGLLCSQLGLSSNNQDIGHAISMYDFCLRTQSIYYKDSSMKAYEMFQYETERPPEGLPLRSTRDSRGLIKFLTMDNQVLEKAWTFKAEYSGAT